MIYDLDPDPFLFLLPLGQEHYVLFGSAREQAVSVHELKKTDFVFIREFSPDITHTLKQRQAKILQSLQSWGSGILFDAFIGTCNLGIKGT